MNLFKRPSLEIIKDDLIKKIIDEAVNIIEKIGIEIENKNAVNILNDYGAKTDKARTHIPVELTEKCISTFPRTIKIFDRDNNLALDLSADNVHFTPGSSALNIYDWEIKTQRKPVTTDLKNFSSLTDFMDNIKSQSTALVSSDVPEEISDRYRLYLALQNSKKPIITGTFSSDGFQLMFEMLTIIRGSKESLQKKPLAIFDCCPISPLKWGNTACQDLMDCAKAGIPATIVPMPLAGATAPGTILDTLVQLTAEILSGIVISQVTKPGAPVIWGGSPAVMDMRHGTTPMGAIETMMISSTSAKIGKYINIPTHAFIGLSDAKSIDVQAGFETGMGIILAVLSGINNISGPGMHDFEMCQSLEKLVIDNEICGNALRLIQGIKQYNDELGKDIYTDFNSEDAFLTSESTVKRLRKEFYFPSEIIERRQYESWLKSGGKSIMDRVHEKVLDLLGVKQHSTLSPEKFKELEKLMLNDSHKHGLENLP